MLAQRTAASDTEPPPRLPSPWRRLLGHVAGNTRGGACLAVYVRRLDTSEPAIALSRDTGEFPVFLHDGKTLALVRERQLVVRSWRDNNGRFEIGPERVVAPLAFGSGWTFGAPYDAAADGRFLALVRTEASPPPRIRVVVGWDPATARRPLQ